MYIIYYFILRQFSFSAIILLRWNYHYFRLIDLQLQFRQNILHFITLVVFFLILFFCYFATYIKDKRVGGWRNLRCAWWAAHCGGWADEPICISWSWRIIRPNRRCTRTTSSNCHPLNFSSDKFIRHRDLCPVIWSPHKMQRYQRVWAIDAAQCSFRLSAYNCNNNNNNNRNWITLISFCLSIVNQNKY